MTCDPPCDHYEAREKNQNNIYAIVHWLNDHLITTGRGRPSLPDSLQVMSPVWGSYPLFSQVTSAVFMSPKQGS
jgi:hypothetical protein